MKKSGRNILKSPLLALPSAGLLLLMVIFPICLLLLFSFSKGNVTIGLPSAFSITNYTDLLTDPTFYSLMIKSIVIGLEVTVICLILSCPAAWALAKVVRPARRNLGILLVIIPFFTSQLLLIYSIMVLFESKGVVMSLLGALRLADPSSSIVYTKACVVIILIYEYLPYMILSLYASLEQIDDSIIMASHTLGAGKFTTFKRVVLPLCMPGVLSGILLVFVPTVGSFVEPAIAGGPSGMMIGTLIDSNFSVSMNMCYGASISLMFLVILLTIVAIINLCLKRFNRAMGGKV